MRQQRLFLKSGCVRLRYDCGLQLEKVWGKL